MTNEDMNPDDYPCESCWETGREESSLGCDGAAPVLEDSDGFCHCPTGRAKAQALMAERERDEQGRPFTPDPRGPIPLLWSSEPDGWDEVAGCRS